MSQTKTVKPTKWLYIFYNILQKNIFKDLDIFKGSQNNLEILLYPIFIIYFYRVPKTYRDF